MGFFKMGFFLCVLFFLVSSATSASGACKSCLYQTRVAYFRSSAALSSGACGYGSLAVGFNAGHLAAAVPRLFKNGAGCGACFQVRCKNTTLCTKLGTRIMVTDLHRPNNESDFVLSSRAFRAMANKGLDQYILKLGIVDVEYKRVPCGYKNQNLSIRVEESSKKPNYLAVKFLYVGGQTEIAVVDVAKAGSSTTVPMGHNYGAVWDTSNAPTGPLFFRIIVPSGFDSARIWTKNALPADWKPGMIYDSGVQITDIAKESCAICDNGSWK